MPSRSAWASSARSLAWSSAAAGGPGCGGPTSTGGLAGRGRPPRGHARGGWMWGCVPISAAAGASTSSCSGPASAAAALSLRRAESAANVLSGGGGATPRSSRSICRSKLSSSSSSPFSPSRVASESDPVGPAAPGPLALLCWLPDRGRASGGGSASSSEAHATMDASSCRSSCDRTHRSERRSSAPERPPLPLSSAPAEASSGPSGLGWSTASESLPSPGTISSSTSSAASCAGVPVFQDWPPPL
mmetsp:Transcript_22712/g.73547  ORF Transcript_22712/g.73547 Transcript_22712/m.73547 type:complete len:246 (-) Transcript_22712:1484-2221(-)|eukprot:scaffold13448_cov109-Isochrysis_galbana.AAC.1